MRLLKRLATLLALAALLGLAACSSLGLAYSQFPRLAGWWVDSYLDLDGSQRRTLDEQLLAWQAWHRQEELPQWLALLRQADAALDDGIVTQDELLALEQASRASVERCLQRAAPLAAPLLTSLRPAQWQHLQKKLADNLAEWREAQGGAGGPAERADQYTQAVSRWLGELDRPSRRQARAEALAWPADVPVLAAARAERQARTVDALRAWSRHELAAGTAQLMRNTQPFAAELPYRQAVLASVLKLLNHLNPAEQARVRSHWAGWAADLRGLQAH
jgi:hypothetical protein